MSTVSVQLKKIKGKNGKVYEQYWIGLPKAFALTEALRIGAGSELEVFIEREI